MRCGDRSDTFLRSINTACVPLNHAFSLCNSRDGQHISRFCLYLFLFLMIFWGFGPWLEFMTHHHNQMNYMKIFALVYFSQPWLCLPGKWIFYYLETSHANQQKIVQNRSNSTDIFQIFFLTTGHPKIHKPQYLRSYPKKFLCSKCIRLSYSLTQSHLARF